MRKVCAILKVLSDHAPLRLTEIADKSSINKATALRVLTMLVEEGFVYRAPGEKSYELGPEAYAMATSARSATRLPELARAALIRLAAKSGDTALLSVRSGNEALYLSKEIGTNPMQPNYLAIGNRRPLGVGAGSLALIAWLPDDEIKEIIAVVTSKRHRNSRITARLLQERIAAARRCGHTFLLDAAYFGMGGVGVPVRDATGAVVGALSIGASSERVGAREDALADMLKAEAAVLSRSLASRRPTRIPA